MSTVEKPARHTPARSAKGRRGAASGVTPLRGLLPLVALLAVWQVVGDPASPYFPVPTQWALAVAELWSEGELAVAIGWTTATFVLGLAAATAVGAVLGTIVGSSRLADRACGPTLEFLRILPAAALLPVFALILGYTMQMKLAVVVLPATWPILLTCRSARRSLSPVLLDVSRTLGLTRRERITKVMVPALIPAVLLGVRVAAPLALIITLLVEIVTRINGLGALLGAAQSNFLSAQVYGLLAISGLLGYLVNWLVTKGETASAARMRATAG